jgi:hypothetical protein
MPIRLIWVEPAVSFRRTHDAAIEHDLTRGELKAIGRGLRAKRSRSRRCANLLGPTDAARQ